MLDSSNAHAHSENARTRIFPRPKLIFFSFISADLICRQTATMIVPNS